MTRSKQEPSALSRAAAREMRDLFVAFIDEGFTENQALTILGHMLRNAADMQEEE
jgi:hypothetical protein